MAADSADELLALVVLEVKAAAEAMKEAKRADFMLNLLLLMMIDDASM